MHLKAAVSTASPLRHHKPQKRSETAMQFELRLTFTVKLFILVSCTPPTQCVASSKVFQVSQAGHRQCPSPDKAFQGLTTKSRIQCAVECKLLPQCIDFSYFAGSGRCYLYSLLPSRLFYHSDCTFMMVSCTLILSIS